MIEDRRCQALMIDGQMLVEMFKTGALDGVRVVAHGLPADARFVSAGHNLYGQLGILIHSDSYPIVPDNEIIPELHPTPLFARLAVDVNTVDDATIKRVMGGKCMTSVATENISPTDVQAIAERSRQDALSFVELNRVQVVDLESLERAGQVRTQIGEKQKSIISQLAKPKSWAYGLHKWFCSLETAALAPYNTLDAYEIEQIRTFNDQQRVERERRERELALEQQRIAQETAASVAAAFEADGEQDIAMAVIQEAIQAPLPVVVLPDAVKAVQSFRRTWHFKVIDESKVPREFLEVAEKRLKKYATAMQASANVPGVQFYYVDDPIR